MRLRLVALAAIPLVAMPLASGQVKPVDPERPSISDVMMKAHQPKRQLYRALDQVVISGRATPEERRRLLELYEAHARAEPPFGDPASWRKDTAELVAAARAVADGDDAACSRLLRAVNCQACHEKYREAPPGV